MRLVLEKNLAYGRLADAELLHASRAEHLEVRWCWEEGRRVCIEVEKCEFLGRLALWRSAFEMLFQGSLEELLKFASSIKPDGTFCVRVEHKPELARLIGGKISGKVDLEKPENYFFVFRHQNDYVLCKKVWEIDNKGFAIRAPQQRPFFLPISLHPKIARAMVNLAEVRKGMVVLDPFCGTAGILIEAGLCGAKIFGNDISKKIVSGAEKNLLTYGISDFKLFCCDVGELPKRLCSVDAIVTDPPYGRSTSTRREARERLYFRAFESFARLLEPGKKVVIILPYKPEEDFPGFVLREHYPIYVHKSLTRNICLFERTD